MPSGLGAMSSGVARRRVAFGKLEDISLPPSGAESIESTIRLDVRDVKRRIDVGQ
jgi:hypothetical protein